MREILDFFKDIFMIKEEARLNIGLSQFRHETCIQKTVVPVIKKKKELKLSDLMRGTVN